MIHTLQDANSSLPRVNNDLHKTEYYNFNYINTQGIRKGSQLLSYEKKGSTRILCANLRLGQYFSVNSGFQRFCMMGIWFSGVLYDVVDRMVLSDMSIPQSLEPENK